MSAPFMPLYCGDLIRDTMHLTPAEFGLYMRLLIHAWNHDGLIPLNDHRLCLITHCEPRIWWKSRDAVLKFFCSVDASTAQHDRIVIELRRYREISKKKKAAALQMHAKRKANGVQVLGIQNHKDNLSSYSEDELRESLKRMSQPREKH
jgi:uncharacterized protein YdaU (DUF1376 family)